MKMQGIGESVVKHLRDLIISGELAPGQRLSEEDLAAKLDVSRSPVREALRALANEQIVEIVPRKGAYVTELSASLLEKGFEAREMVECYAIDMLKRNKVTHLPEVEASIVAAKAYESFALEDRDGFLRYLYAMADFHIKMVETTGNQWIISLAKNIQNYLSIYQFRYLQEQTRREFSDHKHDELLRLISEQKYTEAKKVVKNLIRYLKINLNLK